MSDLTPIPSREWVLRKAGKQLRTLYGPKTRLCIGHIPTFKIVPEDFCRSTHFDVEFMLALLQAGAWLNGHDWTVYVRYTIAKRLRVRSILFPEPFLEMRDVILDYQLNGGTFKTRDSIRKQARQVIQHPESTLIMTTAARLFLSLAEDTVINTLIQPFHWIRATLAASDPNPVFGMYLYQSEMLRQKITLTTMLHANMQDKD